jgi:hypothetical protein
MAPQTPLSKVEKPSGLSGSRGVRLKFRRGTEAHRFHVSRLGAKRS